MQYISRICAANLTITLAFEYCGKYYMEDVRAQAFLYKYDFAVHMH